MKIPEITPRLLFSAMTVELLLISSSLFVTRSSPVSGSGKMFHYRIACHGSVHSRFIAVYRVAKY